MDSADVCRPKLHLVCVVSKLMVLFSLALEGSKKGNPRVFLGSPSLRQFGLWNHWGGAPVEEKPEAVETVWDKPQLGMGYDHQELDRRF